MALCAICNKQSRGFGFKPPTQRVDFLGAVAQPERLPNMAQKRFCSMSCQAIFYELFIQGVSVNKTDIEIKAEQSVLMPLGDYVASIGLDVPLAAYSKEQIEGVVSTIVTSYHRELQRLTNDEIPF